MAILMRQAAVLHRTASVLRLQLRRAGSAVVEFAVIAPLMFLVVFGVIELGRAMAVQETVTSASREACRVAVVDGRTKSDATDRITSMMSSAGIAGYTVAFSPDPPSSAREGTPVIVTVQIPFNNVTWLPSPQFLRNRVLRGSTTLSREGAH